MKDIIVYAFLLFVLTNHAEANQLFLENELDEIKIVMSECISAPQNSLLNYQRDGINRQLGEEIFEELSEQLELFLEEAEEKSYEVISMTEFNCRPNDKHSAGKGKALLLKLK